jgi:hypothetical protein
LVRYDEAARVYVLDDPERYRSYVEDELFRPIVQHVWPDSGEIKPPPIQDDRTRPPVAPPPDNCIVIGTDGVPAQWGIIGKSDERAVIVDLNAPHIVSVFGKMGSGKGYTIGALCEMLASPSIEGVSHVVKPATVIVFHRPLEDTPSEFWSITRPNDQPAELATLGEWGLRPTATVDARSLRVFVDPVAHMRRGAGFRAEYVTDQIQSIYIDPSQLAGQDWALALSLGDSTDALYAKRLFAIIESLAPSEVSLSSVRKAVLDDTMLTDRQKNLAYARLDLLHKYLEPGLSAPVDFSKRLALGGVNIFDFRGTIRMPEDVFSVMTLILSILQTKRGFEHEPFIFVFNEAHLYFRKGLPQEFIQRVDNLIRRKRFTMNWLILDSHNPGDVDERMIEHSDIKILHFSDKTALGGAALLKAFHGSKKTWYELRTGEALISADQSSEGPFTPVLVKIRPRLTLHGAPTKSAT